MTSFWGRLRDYVLLHTFLYAVFLGISVGIAFLLGVVLGSEVDLEGAFYTAKIPCKIAASFLAMTYFLIEDLELW